MAKTLQPILDQVLVGNLESGDSVSRGGIIIRDDIGKEHGIRPRWAQVLAVGPDNEEIKAGEWVLLENGRWTAGVVLRDDDGNDIRIHKADYPKGVLGVSSEKPVDLRSAA
jgi:co-chaperonin GroES (HSP10)